MSFVLCYASIHLSCHYPSDFCFIVLYVLLSIFVLYSLYFFPYVYYCSRILCTSVKTIATRWKPNCIK